MVRYRLGLLAVLFGVLGAASGCGKPVEASSEGQDDPWQVLNREWQVVAGSYGTTPYRPDDVEQWRWTFAGMIRKTDLTWQSAPLSHFPNRKIFATAVHLQELRPAEGLWQIDLTDSPFRGELGKFGVFTLRRQGPDWVLKIRLSTDDGRYNRPDSVEGQKEGYLTVELRSSAP